jgi:hypothetical protein
LIGRNRRKIGITEGYSTTEINLLQSCPYCDHYLEDASHWILHCPPFQHLRDTAIQHLKSEIDRQSTHKTLLRHFSAMATTSPEAHHLWIGTWTPSLIDEFTLAITTPIDQRTLRSQLLSLGNILTQGILCISRARGTYPPTKSFASQIAQHPKLHTLYPLHLLQTSALRAQLRSRQLLRTSRNRSSHFSSPNSGNPAQAGPTRLWVPTSNRRSHLPPRAGIG